MSTKEEITLLSHLYPEMYPIPPQQGEAKRRRRRKKAKVEGGEGGEGRKRKLTQQQINVLELNFKDDHKLESEKKERLAMELGLEGRQVAVWFQNRRARYKTRKMEDEYSQLKAQHDIVVAQKCQLEIEILELQEKLSGMEKVAHNLIAERNIAVNGRLSSDSPSSSTFLVEAMNSTDSFMETFAMGGFNDIFYVPEYYYDYVNIQGSNNGWVNLFDG